MFEDVLCLKNIFEEKMKTITQFIQGIDAIEKLNKTEKSRIVHKKREDRKEKRKGGKEKMYVKKKDKKKEKEKNERKKKRLEEREKQKRE